MTDKTKDEERKATLRKWRRRAVIIGVVLGLVCKMLPPDYQAPCAAIAKLCTFGG